MTVPMNREQVAAARARADAASDGPWEPDLDREAVATEMELRMICRMDLTGATQREGEERWANAELIARARTDLPDALDTLETAVELLCNVFEGPSQHWFGATRAFLAQYEGTP